MIYRLIETEHGVLSTRRRCAIASISPSAYYAWSHRGGTSEPAEPNLVKEIRAILEEFPGCGHRRVTKEFHRRGVTVNKKRVQRLMQHYHLQRRPRRRFVRTTDSQHSLRVYPNLIRELVFDLCAFDTRLCVSGSDPGPLQPQSDWLGTVEPSESRAGTPSAAEGVTDAQRQSRVDPSFGSRCAVCLTGLCRTAPAPRHPDQHESKRESV